MVLYRKYRPKNFSQVVGQEHVTQTLQGALKTGSVAHAYLFTGPRGTGKTTIARLLAKAVNCDRAESEGVLRPEGRMYDACGVCSFCKEVEEGKAFDLVEIDAASNRGIEEIRALREGARFASARGKHKIYIIDECHQLTKEASNALLKTLEEPPVKTIFILATTEASKVLPTIASRTQRFDFKKLNSEQIVAKLQNISFTEKIDIDKNILLLIAEQSEGSLRDAESSLSKLVAFRGNKIDEEAVKEILGFIPENIFFDFFQMVKDKKKSEAVSLINNLYESGLDLDNFVKGLLGYIRKILIARASGSNLNRANPNERIQALAASFDSKYIFRLFGSFMRAQQEMKISPIPQLPLEIAVVELTED
ncbi:MAG: DNA polymerase III subunit gamma/tau [Candidatus Yanofskybacteria bacterium]|nr:DNA polymerase III subunit gamma/tau [Candidatus Yanofskybacteria bacterium]